MPKGERDIIFLPDGELFVGRHDGVNMREDPQPKITVRLIKSGLIPRSPKRQATYGIFGDPGR